MLKYVLRRININTVKTTVKHKKTIYTSFLCSLHSQMPQDAKSPLILPPHILNTTSSIHSYQIPNSTIFCSSISSPFCLPMILYYHFVQSVTCIFTNPASFVTLLKHLLHHTHLYRTRSLVAQLIHSPVGLQFISVLVLRFLG